MISFVDPYGINQEGADPNTTGSADSHEKKPWVALRLINVFNEAN